MEIGTKVVYCTPTGVNFDAVVTKDRGDGILDLSVEDGDGITHITRIRPLQPDCPQEGWAPLPNKDGKKKGKPPKADDENDQSSS